MKNYFGTPMDFSKHRLGFPLCEAVKTPTWVVLKSASRVAHTTVCNYMECIQFLNKSLSLSKRGAPT